jgi:putative transposase
MVQMTRYVTMEAWGFLVAGPHLIHDRDGKYGPALQHIIAAAGVTHVPLPPRPPPLNAYAERWVRSIPEECLSQLILCGETSRCHALTPYVEHDHQERNHQGKGNVLLLPRPSPGGEADGPMPCHERLGGLLQYDERKAA